MSVETEICPRCKIPMISGAKWRRLPAAVRAQHLKNRTLVGRKTIKSCGPCYRRYGQYEYPEHEIALRGGRWVRRGLKQVWVPFTPEEHPRSTVDPDLVDDVVREAIGVTPPERVVKLRAELCDCGCLTKPNEFCPACLAWAEKDSIRHSWKRIAA